MRIAILVLLAWFLLASGNAVFAADEVGVARIDPSSPLYFLKAVKENLELKFSKDNDSKVVKQLEFSSRRIREVNSLVSKNRLDLIPPTLENYWAIYTPINSHLNLTDQNLLIRITDQIYQHLTNLDKLYNQLSDKRARIFIRSTINRLSMENSQLLEKIDKVTKEDPKLDFTLVNENLVKNKSLACDLLVKIASSSGLNDTEKVVLTKRAHQCKLDF